MRRGLWAGIVLAAAPVLTHANPAFTLDRELTPPPPTTLSWRPPASGAAPAAAVAELTRPALVAPRLPPSTYPPANPSATSVSDELSPDTSPDLGPSPGLGATPAAGNALYPEPATDDEWRRASPGAGVEWTGVASVYHRRFEGRPTASGEPYEAQGWTAAHRDLPMGTLLSVRNPANGVEVVVRVNDRGPYHGNRLLDLSTAAAEALGLLRLGVAMVVVRPLSEGESAQRSVGVQLGSAWSPPKGWPDAPDAPDSPDGSDAQASAGAPRATPTLTRAHGRVARAQRPKNHRTRRAVAVRVPRRQVAKAR